MGVSLLSEPHLFKFSEKFATATLSGQALIRLMEPLICQRPSGRNKRGANS